MTDNESSMPVGILLDSDGTVWSGIPDAPSYGDEISVSQPQLALLLEDATEVFEDLFTNELIIPVDDHEYFVRLAEFCGCPVQIGHRHLPLLVDHNLHLTLRDLAICGVLLDEFARPVIRGVIDEYYAIIAVVLLQDGVHVVEVPIFGRVVVAGHHHADGHFFIL